MQTANDATIVPYAAVNSKYSAGGVQMSIRLLLESLARSNSWYTVRTSTKAVLMPITTSFANCHEQRARNSFSKSANVITPSAEQRGQQSKLRTTVPSSAQS